MAVHRVGRRAILPGLVAMAAGLTGQASAGQASAGQADAEPALRIVAAENFYADVARQIAGPDAVVSAILSNPDSDPHMFEASPSVARALAGASIVIANGADYDPWMAKLLAASPAAQRRSLVVAGLLHRAPGGNPHLWYDPAALPALAVALTGALSAMDPGNAAAYAARLAAFQAGFAPVVARVAALRAKFAGVPVTATEPVFGPMAAALGLAMRNERFQLAVMNGTEPAASDVMAFERDIKQRAVRVLFYNSQASDPSAQRLLAMAQAAHIPVVGVTETQPAGTTVQGWLLSTLDAVAQALSGPAS